MAIDGIAKSVIRTRAFTLYNEATGGLDFTGTAVNTLMNEAQQEFALRTHCLLGSTRVARPDVASGNEALVSLPTGGFSANKVLHLRYAGAGTALKLLRRTTEDELRLREGVTWATDTDTISGTASKNHAWYRKAKQIGFYPPNMTATAGTALIWYHRVPDAMANDTTVCEIPAEFAPGVIYITCRKMAEKDPDADSEQRRVTDFESKAAMYVNMAAGYRPRDVEA